MAVTFDFVASKKNNTHKKKTQKRSLIPFCLQMSKEVTKSKGVKNSNNNRNLFELDRLNIIQTPKCESADTSVKTFQQILII